MLYVERLLKEKYFYIALPIAVVFLANIFITQIKGFSFIGQIAIFTAASNLFAIIAAHRMDIEILSDSREDSKMKLINGMIGAFIIIILSLPILSFFLFTDYMDYLFILLLSLSISLNEILTSFFLRNDSYKKYILFKSLPPIALIFFSISYDSPLTAWLSSYSFVLCFILANIFFETKGSQLNYSLIFKHCIKNIITKIAPTTVALISAFGSFLWLFLINYKIGAEAAGIWSNIYRIFSLPIILYLSIFLPISLLEVGQSASTIKKFTHLKIFTFKYSLLSITLILVSMMFGQFLFSFFTGYSEVISYKVLMPIIFFIILKNFIGYHQSFFQAFKKNFILLFVLSIEIALAGYLMISNQAFELEYLLNTIFLSLLLCFSILFIYICKLNFSIKRAFLK